MPRYSGGKRVAFKVTDDSIRRLQKRSAEYLSEVRSKAQGVILRYGRLIVAEARRLVPVLTGALRASIELKVVIDQLERFVVALTAGMHYAPFVELGTSKMAAQPFLMPAWMTYRDRFIAALKRVFNLA